MLVPPLASRCGGGSRPRRSPQVQDIGPGVGRSPSSDSPPGSTPRRSPGGRDVVGELGDRAEELVHVGAPGRDPPACRWSPRPRGPPRGALRPRWPGRRGGRSPHPPPARPRPGPTPPERTDETRPPYAAGKPPEASSTRSTMSALKTEKIPPRWKGLKMGKPSRRIEVLVRRTSPDVEGRRNVGGRHDPREDLDGADGVGLGEPRERADVLGGEFAHGDPGLGLEAARARLRSPSTSTPARTTARVARVTSTRTRPSGGTSARSSRGS
jgi:hypothetical protein